MTLQSAAETVFSTPWFEVVAKPNAAQAGGAPHYALRLLDYVCTIALTPAGDFVLVRQFRPAIERMTLELPAGHVDPGETPAESARRELIEETGLAPARIEPLGPLAPDTGRLSNVLWSFLALDCVPTVPVSCAEAGIEVVICPLAELADKIRCGEFDHALHLAALQLAMLAGKLPQFATPFAQV
jgi:ADP-ribose pyrophosphatase